mmetsp:Transcript_39105/g.84175  ORF Transcript_39105/g.84175 Transcript_39105/m.84175 type:complete len:138 (+) Transcript_39105:49-462(+)
MNIISHKELAKHNGDGDVWMAIHGVVYDVSNFMHEHPGGSQLLEDVAGRDASLEFEDALHSDAARKEEKLELKGFLEGSEEQVQKFRESGWDEGQGIPDPEALLSKNGVNFASAAPILLVGAIAAAAAAWFIASRKK